MPSASPSQTLSDDQRRQIISKLLAERRSRSISSLPEEVHVQQDRAARVQELIQQRAAARQQQPQRGEPVNRQDGPLQCMVTGKPCRAAVLCQILDPATHRELLTGRAVCTLQWSPRQLHGMQQQQLQVRTCCSSQHWMSCYHQAPLAAWRPANLRCTPRLHNSSGGCSHHCNNTPNQQATMQDGAACTFTPVQTQYPTRPGQMRQHH
ncbi:hypothetical protein COO60DRAFT_461684 [Scenedesmus sp. NREL 46B-D3]|nr:hypothetical protein COO60DRAFT_461684 [Scenedesmus sp. NREL 46B-D3]